MSMYLTTSILLNIKADHLHDAKKKKNQKKKKRKGMIMVLESKRIDKCL